MSDEEIRISVVDDDSAFNESTALLVNGSVGLSCVSQYFDGRAAIAGLPGDCPDVVLLDLQMPMASGIECLRELKPKLSETQFLILTTHSDDQQVFEALQAGAMGYLLKRSKPIELLEAIREIHEGGSPMSSYIARLVVKSFAACSPLSAKKRLPILSPREHEIVELFSQSFSYKEIAAHLNISLDTVRTYVRRIYEKLQVRSRTEAVVKYLGR